VRRFLSLLLSTALLLQPLHAAEAPYFRFSIPGWTPAGTPGATDPGTTDPLPPNVDPNSVKGDGELVVYAPVSVRARIDVDFTLQFVAQAPKDPVAWTLVRGTLPEGLGLTSAGLLSGRPRLIQDAAGIVLQAVDASGRKGTTKPFTIEVKPVPTVSMPTPTAAPAGQFVAIAPVKSGIFGSQTWRLSGGLPVGMDVNPLTGTVSGIPEQKGRFGDLSVEVTDSDGAKAASNAFEIDVDARMTISGLTSSYVARQSRPVTPIRPMVTGNEGQVSWDLSKSSAPLPSGLTVNASTGTVTGIPATVGKHEGILLRATDSSDGASLGSPTFGITVAGPPTATADAAYFGRFGSEVSFRPVSANILGDSVWSLSGGLPAGLSFNRMTGAVSGRMGSLGSSTGLVLTVTDLFDGETARTGTFSITGWPALAIETPDAPATKVGARFGMPAPSVTGLRGTAVHTLSGTVPPGLAVDAATGAITGVPSTAGVYANLVRSVRDTADDATASSRPVRVEVLGPTATIPFAVSPMAARYGATVDVPFVLTPSTTGETATVTWSMVGTVPAPSPGRPASPWPRTPSS
jgi:hypothetical protein